jgi:hypothetical protein
MTFEGYGTTWRLQRMTRDEVARARIVNLEFLPSILAVTMCRWPFTRQARTRHSAMHVIFVKSWSRLFQCPSLKTDMHAPSDCSGTGRLFVCTGMKAVLSEPSSPPRSKIFTAGASDPAHPPSLSITGSPCGPRLCSGGHGVSAGRQPATGPIPRATNSPRRQRVARRPPSCRHHSRRHRHARALSSPSASTRQPYLVTRARRWPRIGRKACSTPSRPLSPRSLFRKLQKCPCLPC